jgi:hypothetical protein
MEETKYLCPITGELKSLKELKTVKDALSKDGRISLVFKKTNRRFF